MYVPNTNSLQNKSNSSISSDIKTKIIIKSKLNTQSKDKNKRLQIKPRIYSNQYYNKASTSYNYIKRPAGVLSQNNYSSNIKQIRYKKRAASNYNKSHYLNNFTYSEPTPENINNISIGKKSIPNYSIKSFTINNELGRNLLKSKEEELVLNLFNKQDNTKNNITVNNISHNLFNVNYGKGENDNQRLNTVNEFPHAGLGSVEFINMNETTPNKLFNNKFTTFNNSPLKDNNSSSVNENNQSNVVNDNTNNVNVYDLNSTLPINNYNVSNNINSYANNNQFLSSQTNANVSSDKIISMTSSIINL